MPAKAEAIAAQITNVLTAQAGSIGLAAVYRDRTDAFTREESPVALVEISEEDSAPLGSSGRGGFGVDIDVLRLQVIYCVRTPSGWQTTLDGIRTRAHAALVQDATLQTLCGGAGAANSFRRDRAQWAGATTDVPLGTLAQTYTCKYHTPNQALDAS